MIMDKRLLKVWRERTDPTGKRIFFQLLHKAREFKEIGMYSAFGRAHLVGMWEAFKDNREDFTIADKMRDQWKQGGVFE